MFLTTPNGMNWVHGLFESAASSTGWARWQRPTSENPIVPATEIEAARRDMGPLLFSQEFMAEFVTAGAGLFKPEWLEQRYEPYGADHWRLPDGTKITRNSVSAFATVDLAVSTKTTADFTVIAVVGRTPDGRLLLLHVDRARREGPDIVCELPISITEAALGAKVPVPTLTGAGTIKIPAGIHHGTRLRLRGRGVPQDKGGRGDQLVTVVIEAPDAGPKSTLPAPIRARLEGILRQLEALSGEHPEILKRRAAQRKDVGAEEA